MQAITTKYIGPTNFKGSRVKASCQARSIIRHWDNSLNPDENHTKVAKELATILGWDYGRWIGGEPQDGKGWVFVCDTFRASVSFTVEQPKAA